MGNEIDMLGIDFRSAFRDVTKGMVLKPILQNYLDGGEFPRFSITFEPEDGIRKPDGWFHPSQHPLWPERALYHYLANPDRLVLERLGYMSVLSITIGKAMHGFIQTCADDAGVMPKAMQVCTVCPPELECPEPGVIDEEVGERGHMDGLLDFSGISVPSAAFEFPIFEFKTTNDMALRKIDDLDLEAFRKKWPEYWAQQQSYQRMSGRRMTVVFMMAMGYPWPMREFHIPFDYAFASATREKYLGVRQAVADQAPSRSCCLGTAAGKSCPSRRLCEMSVR